MVSTIQKNIIIRALRIRQEAGEQPEKVLTGYKNLSEEEKTEILAIVVQGKE